jgi:hypothetical protein
MTGCWFQNADYRIFDFDEETAPNGIFKLKQWESTKAHGGLGRSWPEMVVIGDGLPDEDDIVHVLYESGPG